MRVRMLYFGVLKDLFGEAADVGLPEGADVSAMLEQHRDRAGDFAWGSIAVAVNREYAKGSQVLCEGDEVALLPPVSGGCGAEALLPREASEILRCAQNDNIGSWVRKPSAAWVIRLASGSFASLRMTLSKSSGKKPDNVVRDEWSYE